MINIAGIIHNDLANGPGIRCTVFVQGCRHHCKGCHNPETWKRGAGKDMTADDIFQEITNNKLDTGVTISGGEPVDQYKELLPLIEKLKRVNYDLMLYTGYTAEELEQFANRSIDFVNFLRPFEYIVCDPFILEERDLTLKFRGSRNQRIITTEYLGNAAPYLKFINVTQQFDEEQG